MTPSEKTFAVSPGKSSVLETQVMCGDGVAMELQLRRILVGTDREELEYQCPKCQREEVITIDEAR